MPENNLDKVSTLWTCQTNMENMSTVLKPEEILFWDFFSTNTASVTDVFEIIVQLALFQFNQALTSDILKSIDQSHKNQGEKDAHSLDALCVAGKDTFVEMKIAIIALYWHSLFGCV